MKKNNKIRLVTIGGGSGQYVLLSGLRDMKCVNLTSIVSMVDSGGSSGRLRDELGVLPPSDALKCVLALSPIRDVAREILLTRFIGENRLKGHKAGNMLLSMLSQYAGSFPDGINALGDILQIKGKVLPVTTDKATLVAELADGKKVFGETNIDLPLTKRSKIVKTLLVPHHSDAIHVYEPVIKAIKKANYIIIGPGDLYTSITPNFLVPGVVEEIKKSKAKIIYVVNIMTKFGESDGFSVNDFITTIEKSIKRKVNYIIVNNAKVEHEILNRYEKQNADYVKINKKLLDGSRKYIIDNFLNKKGDVVRHDSTKLSDAIFKIINK